VKIELIQPFINAADAVMAEMLETTTQVGDVSMEEEAYRRKGVAAMISIEGDIHGRVIFDVDPPTAAKVASKLAGCPVSESDEMVRETACEIANMIIGNAVTSLNDQGFQYRIIPTVVHAADEGFAGSEDTEALTMVVETPEGNLYLNIAMRYNRRRRRDQVAATAV
jgi:chemotaxis protein CheX